MVLLLVVVLLLMVVVMVVMVTEGNGVAMGAETRSRPRDHDAAARHLGPTSSS